MPFVTFEGIEGSGKTSQMRRVAEVLRAAGRQVVTTKEPGGTPLADRIRAILLDTQSVIDPVAELFLFAASRRQHVTEVIRPALDRGEVVLCDRFTDSTLAYQGFGRMLPLGQLRMLNDWATGNLHPATVVIFDIDEETSVSRARRRNQNASSDEGRFEAEDLRFHRRTREGYLTLALAEPDRYLVIDATGTTEDVFVRLLAALRSRAPELFS